MSVASLIPELDKMIQHGSLSRRAGTLRRLTNLFAEGASQFKSDHIEVFEQVFRQLIDEVDAAARTELAHRLSSIAAAPRGVLRRLAEDDDIATARPVLTHSQALEEADLVEIAETKSQPHLLALAKRRHIAQPLSEKLVDRGDREVLGSLAENRGAQFSETSFAALLQTAAQDSGLAEKVGKRRDLPPGLLRQLLVEATPVVRERLLASATSEKVAEIRRILAELGEDAQAKAAPRDYTTAERKLLELRRNGKLDEAALVEFASNGQYEEMIVSLACLCAVPIDVVDRLMNADRIDPILILCKSAGWEWQTVKALKAATPHANAMSTRELDSAYDNFERLSPTTAQRVMRFWQVQHWQRTTGEE